MAKDISYIKDDVAEIKLKIESDYITRQEFEPIKRIVYGIITLLLTGMVGALLKVLLIP